MSDHDHDQQQWGDCPPGELTALACRLRTRERELCAQRRWQRARKITQYGAPALLVVVGIGVLLATRGSEPPRSIGCRECAAHFEAYHRHLIHAQQMDTALAEQMRIHFARCASCRNAFERRFPGVLIAIATDAVDLVVGIHRVPAGTIAALLDLAASP